MTGDCRVRSFDLVDGRTVLYNTSADDHYLISDTALDLPDCR